MLITRIELENIKSYRQIIIDFRRGTTAISGANGAGKTTIVEAIGFALFDFLPYSQAQFVREGEKYGHIVVHLIGSDDRPYVVDRRCGAGAFWSVYDCEADSRIEQRTDVQEKLQTQQSEIQRLEFETRDLEQWRVDLIDERQRDQQQTQQFTQWTRQREQLEARFDVLIKQRDEVTRLNNLYERSKDNYDSLQ